MGRHYVFQFLTKFCSCLGIRVFKRWFLSHRFSIPESALPVGTAMEMLLAKKMRLTKGIGLCATAVHHSETPKIFE